MKKNTWSGNSINRHSVRLVDADVQCITTLYGLVVQHLPSVQEVVGSIYGWVTTKTLKIIFGASFLSGQH